MSNESGIHPYEYKVLIKPIKVEEKTEGGIIMPDTVLEREEYANGRGILIANGALAFSQPDWGDYPKPGDKVLFDKYGGTIQVGVDGVEYRLMNDKEIAAKLS